MLTVRQKEALVKALLLRAADEPSTVATEDAMRLPPAPPPRPVLRLVRDE